MSKEVDFEASNSSCFGVLGGRHNGWPTVPVGTGNSLVNWLEAEVVEAVEAVEDG